MRVRPMVPPILMLALLHLKRAERRLERDGTRSRLVRLRVERRELLALLGDGTIDWTICAIELRVLAARALPHERLSWRPAAA